MITQSITDPDQITGLLRQLDIFRREREAAKFGNTRLDDLLEEARIVENLLDIQERLSVNILEEVVRRSIEGE